MSIAVSIRSNTITESKTRSTASDAKDVEKGTR
jgi:hypothetical protein